MAVGAQGAEVVVGVVAADSVGLNVSHLEGVF
jgi:hypothetical protein